MEKEVYLSDELYKSLNNLILYQNNILLKSIANDYNWNLRNLKKYIKDKPIKNKIPKKEEKKIKIKKEMTNDLILDEESDSEVKIIKKKVVIKKKIRVKKSSKNEYDLIQYLGNLYYVDLTNNYVYSKIKNDNNDLENLEVEFVGILEDKKINFDAESSS